MNIKAVIVMQQGDIPNSCDQCDHFAVFGNYTCTLLGAYLGFRKSAFISKRSPKCPLMTDSTYEIYKESGK